MDFYYCNNIVRQDFEGVVVKWSKKLGEWAVVGVGYPYLSFSVQDMSFYLKCYEKISDRVFF